MYMLSFWIHYSRCSYIKFHPFSNPYVSRFFMIATTIMFNYSVSFELTGSYFESSCIDKKVPLKIGLKRLIGSLLEVLLAIRGDLRIDRLIVVRVSKLFTYPDLRFVQEWDLFMCHLLIQDGHCTVLLFFCRYRNYAILLLTICRTFIISRRVYFTPRIVESIAFKFSFLFQQFSKFFRTRNDVNEHVTSHIIY